MNDRCRHTVHLTDQRGQRCVSRMDETVGNRVRVVCRVCGKFCGYRPSKRERRTVDRGREARAD